MSKPLFDAKAGTARSRHRLGALFAAVAAVLAVLCMLVQAAKAHPHVWVSAKATILYENGVFTGFHHVWAFDDMYSTMAIEGLDKNGDGKFDRAELAELAKINIDGLKDFNYFTFAKLGDQDLAVKTPTDYWLDYDEGTKSLKLHFILPLATPVLSEARGFRFAVEDPSFFIAFEFVKDQPITLSASTPKHCSAELVAPNPAATGLSEAFAQELGGLTDPKTAENGAPPAGGMPADGIDGSIQLGASVVDVSCNAKRS